jgi:hypothetical protein
VLALTCHIELFVLAHYRQSIDTDAHVCELWEGRVPAPREGGIAARSWTRWNGCARTRRSSQARDAAVDDLIALVGAVDGILQVQSLADTHYFVEICGRPMTAAEVEALRRPFSLRIGGNASSRASRIRVSGRRSAA